MHAQQATANGTHTTEAEPQKVLLDKVIDQTCTSLDAIALSYSTAMRDTLAPLRRAMVLADGVVKLKAAITKDVMGRVMGLMNTKMGFKTDRPSKKDNTDYPEAVVKNCLIEALLQGVYPVGNEFNIIAGGMYITREGYERKVSEIPGLTDLEVIPGIPTAHNGRTVVRMAVTWKLHGIKKQLVDHEGKPGRNYAIIAYESSSADAIIGKAIRKALKATYMQVTGSLQTSDDGDVDEIVPVSEIDGSKAKSKEDAIASKLVKPADRTEPAKPTDAPRLDEEQLMQLTDSLRDNGCDVALFLQEFGVKVLKQVSASAFELAMKWCVDNATTPPDTEHGEELFAGSGNAYSK